MLMCHTTNLKPLIFANTGEKSGSDSRYGLVDGSD